VSAPYNLNLGDFNNDGKIDIIEINEGSNNAYILLGQGDGTFQIAPGSPIPVGAAPYSVAVGDLNNDSKMDFVITNGNSNNLSILLGNGDGTFTPAPSSPFAITNNPRHVVAIDFNHDGKLDLAVTCLAGTGMTILLGDGSGGFSNAPGSPISSGQDPYWAVAGDFDSNGTIDLATTTESVDTIVIFPGNGDGTFGTSVKANNPGDADGILFSADFNNDGKPDLTVLNLFIGNVNVLLNTTSAFNVSSTCNQATPIGHSGNCQNNQLQGSLTGWFSFIPDSANCVLTLSGPPRSNSNIIGIQVYSGSCSGLTLVSSKSIPTGNDSIVTDTLLNLTKGNTYLIQTVKDTSCPSCLNKQASFNLCVYNISSDGAVTFFQGCGLNYALGSVPLNQRFHAPVSNPASVQPANVTISGIPTSCVKVIAAYVWFSVVGTVSPFQTYPGLILNDPYGNPITRLSNTNVWGNNNSATCWEGYTNGSNVIATSTNDYQASFDPAYFNNLISSNKSLNGNYVVGGLPTILTSSTDVSGATLIIIYEDLSSSLTGTLMLWNGVDVTTGGGPDQDIRFLSDPRFSVPSGAIGEKAFFVGSDFENGFIVGPNNGDYYGINNDGFNPPSIPLSPFQAPNQIAMMWNTVEEAPPANGTFPLGATSIPFSFYSAGDDCYNIVGLGAYYQTSKTACPPFAPIAGASQTICAPGAAILSATGGGSYSWSPATGLSCTNCQLPTATPAVTTTYTVTVTSPFGCVGSATTTVTVVQPPSVTISPAGPANICLGSSVPLLATPTGTGPFTYSWSPSAGLNTTTGPSVSATPLSTTTYTVSLTGSSGCVGTATITINVNTDHCCLNPNYTFNTSFQTSSMAPFNTGSVTGIIDIGPGVIITVNSALTLTNCIMRFGAGAGIVVLAPQTLNVINNSHLYSCTDTWNGIKLNASSSLNFNSNSWLEDAQIGIESVGGANYTINTGILNRNYINIQVDPLLTSHPGTISNSVISCRQIPFFPKPMVASLTGQLVTLPITNLPPPNNIRRTYIGMYINSVQTIQVGNPAGMGNYFDNMDYGVWLKESGGVVQNNLFQYLSGKNILSYPNPYNIGIAIYGQLTGNFVRDITAGGTSIGDANSIFECFRGVDISGDYRNITVQENFLHVNAPNGTGIIPGTLTGSMGIYINPSTVNNITVTNNNMTNFLTGIMQSRRSTSSGNIVSYSNNKVMVTSSSFHTTGMVFSDPVTVAPVSSFTVDNNTILAATDGIRAMNIIGNGPNNHYEFSLNACQTLYISSSNASGMNFQGCKYIEAHNNHVHCDPLAAQAGGNINEYGIYLQNSPFMYIHCNLIENEGRSMVFEGTCTSTSHFTSGVSTGSGILQNTMSFAQDGFVLLNNGIIGRQGTPAGASIFHPAGIASDNYWNMSGGGTFSNSETFVILTSFVNTNSPLCNSQLQTGPQATFPSIVNDKSAPGGLNYTSVGLPPAHGLPAACGSVPHSMSSTYGLDSLYASEIEQIINDGSVLPVFSAETHILRKQSVYDVLQDQSSIMTGNSTLQNFYNDNLRDNMQKFKDVEQDIAAGSYRDALRDNNAIHPANTIEANQKTSNALLISMLLNPSTGFDSTQIVALNNLAMQCPLSAGNSVYQARAMLYLFQGQVVEFPNRCDSVTSHSGHQMAALNGATESSSVEFKLYPNPNDGNVFLEYSLKEGESGELAIYDIAGKEITKILLPASSNGSKTNCDYLSNGVYLYHYIVNGQIQKTGKITIIK